MVKHRCNCVCVLINLQYLKHPITAETTGLNQHHLPCQSSVSGCTFSIKAQRGGLVNFRHSFAVLCLPKSQCGWSTAEHTKGRAKTSLTTTEIQGGCTTIYNLPSLLCDSRGGWREEQREGGDTDSDGGWPVNSRAEEKTIVFFPLTGALCEQHTG